MDNNYREALSEVLEVLKNTSPSVLEKIPKKFINFLEDNCDNNYNVKIDFSDNNWDNYVKEETQAILALIYRDYICTKEEKEKIIKEEKIEEELREQELREKFNPDNLFKNEKQENIAEVELIEINDEPWYKKIWKKIIYLFGKK